MMMCKAATRLMSKQLDAPLTTRERVALRFHLMLCSACRHCDRQFGMLHGLGERFPSSPGDEAPATANDDAGSDKAKH
ncbi:zf-HC2 domain-containing protein [Halomonas sp. V046]|uniref:zf-HC2 domain-containing protein n=1 Tax=Halomonas sp. V046 TaxID=3459611 RepID=UPI00404463E6